MIKKLIILIFFISLFTFGYSQYAYRLNANILTKTRLPDSTFQISKGKIHYDLNYKKIIFDFTFPEKEKAVLFDTLMYTYRADTLYSRTNNFLIPEQSFFHYMLSGQFSNYGLDESNFTAKGIEKKKDMVITTWIPPVEMKEFITKVLVATKNKQLYSITMMGPEERVLNRQILKNYLLIEGIDIPTEILVATYLEQGIMYQVITLNDVILNEAGNDEKYNYEF